MEFGNAGRDFPMIFHGKKGGDGNAGTAAR